MAQELTVGNLTLSIMQPWAWLIVNGYKDVENRTWSTNVRGRILIHAGKQFDKAGYDGLMRSALVRSLRIPMLRPPQFERGGVVGAATLVDCVDASESGWFSGPYGFVLQDAKPLTFKPCRGMLGFFRYLG